MHNTQIIQNRNQAVNGNHNVVTVMPGQQTMQPHFAHQQQRMAMMPHGQPPFSAAQGVFYQPTMLPPPTFVHYPTPTSEHAQLTPMNMNPNFNMPLYMAPPAIFHQHHQPPMLAPPQQASQPKPREKNILKIVDPSSQQVVNENDINASKMHSGHQKTVQIISPASESKIIQQFSLAVSNRFMSNEGKVSVKSDASVTETRSSSLDFNDNKSEAIFTQLNGQFEEESVSPRLIEELKEDQSEDGHEISEIVTPRSVKDNENDGELPTDIESKESESSIIEDLDKNLRQYYEQAKDSIDNMVYDRNFLQLIREVVHKLNKSGDLVNPLKTEEELKEMGIDQASVPTFPQTDRSREQPRQENVRSDKFMPDFGNRSNQLNRSLNKFRPGYAGRRSDNREQRNPRVIERHSITRQPVVETLRRAENAWKPSLGKTDEKEKKRKEIRGILNKITPTTFKDLTNEFLSHKLYEDESTLPMIVDLIFDKAVEEQKFISLYSALCNAQTEEEKRVPNSTRPFRLAIIKKCQTTFERSTKNSTEEAIESTKKEIDEETKKEGKDEKKLKELQERLEELQGKEKRRMLGTIRFIGELYRHMLITENIIHWCAMNLIKQYQTSNNDVHIEYVVQLIETVGPIHEKRTPSTPFVQPQKSSPQAFNTSQILVHLDQLKEQVSTRICFAIMDLIELKKNKWVPLHGNSGPKTKEEIRNEAVLEELEKGKKREDYEKQQQQQKYRERDNDQKRPRQYGGSGSVDKFQHEIQRRALAAKASQTTSTNLRKDVSGLSEPHGLSKRSKWTTGAAGGGAGGSAEIKQLTNTKVVPPYPGRMSEKSHQSTSRVQPSRNSTPKQNERINSPAMNKARTEGTTLAESSEELTETTEQGPSQEKVVPEVNRDKIMNSVKSYLKECLAGNAKLDEASNNIKSYCTDAELTRAVFFSMFDYTVSEFKPHEDDKRRKVVEVFRRALQAKERKSDAIQGVVDFVEYAVEYEIGVDVPQVWQYIAFIICTAILNEESKERKEDDEEAVRLFLQDFTPVFESLSRKDVTKPFGLFILVLKGIIENFKQTPGEEDIPTIMSMTFAELKDPFYKSNGLAEALRNEKISIGEFDNLYSLLNS